MNKKKRSAIVGPSLKKEEVSNSGALEARVPGVLRPLGRPEFDWYSCTMTWREPLDVAEALMCQGHSVGLVRQKRGYLPSRLEILDSEQRLIAAINWDLANSYLHVEINGYDAPAVVARLRHAFPVHSVSRVDACVDFEQPDAWRLGTEYFNKLAQKYNLFRQMRGDESRPEKGLTLELGAKHGLVKGLLYMKGRHPEYRHQRRPDWVRVEIRVNVKRADARKDFAQKAPLEVFGVSRWTRELALVICQETAPPAPVYRLPPRGDLDHSLDFMVKNYKKRLESLVGRLGGWDAVGPDLQGRYERVQKGEAQWRK